MAKNKDFQWDKFIYEFEQMHSFYRRGLFEIVIDLRAPGGYRELETAPRREKNSLLNFADRLYQTALTAWQSQTIPQDYFSQVLKTLVCSFEIDEYFHQITTDKKIFFRDFLDDFLQSSAPLEKNFQNKCKEVSERISPVPSFEVPEIFIKLADEILMICLCGINVYYKASGEATPQDGLQRTEKLMEYIDYLSKYKKMNYPSSIEDRGLGLRGLANYFRGRFLFSLGRYNEAEQAFDESSSNYLEKMFWKTDSVEKDDAESRALSLRRANLAKILGSTRIYLRQSRIKDALKFLEKARPFLSFSTGKVMSRIADLTYIGAKRIKYSSHYETLVESKDLAEKCREDFERYIPNSYYVHRCDIEISLINYFLENFANSKEAKLELLNESIRKINVVIEHYRQPDQKKLSKNRRLLVEALTVGSHIRRKVTNIEQFDDLNNFNLAINDAQEAVDLAEGMKQLKCSAYIALALAYREILLNLIESEKAQKLDDSEINKDFFVNKQKALDCFFEALSLNEDENPRVTAISYLRVAEIELLRQPNYVLSEFYFKKFKKYENKIEHQYVLDFAAGVEKKLSERQVPEFYLDTSKSLNYKEWSKNLKECLIRHAIFQIAIELKGKMPAKRRKCDSTQSEDTSINKNTRQTRQSLLAGVFKEKMGLAQNEAFDLASKHLKEFESLCNIIARTSK